MAPFVRTGPEERWKTPPTVAQGVGGIKPGKHEVGQCGATESQEPYLVVFFGRLCREPIFGKKAAHSGDALSERIEASRLACFNRLQGLTC